MTRSIKAGAAAAVLVTALFAIVITMGWWYPRISDFREYLAIKNADAATVSVQKDSYVLLTGEKGGQNDRALQLAPEEGTEIAELLCALEDVRLIARPAAEPGAIRTVGLMGGTVIYYPSYFTVGGSFYATGENYSAVYQQMRERLLAIEPETHVPDRPI